jgi:hypothetical protein
VLFSGFANLTAPADIRPLTSVSTVAGSSTSGSADGPISLATFNGLAGVAAGPNGVLYVADYSAGNIREISGGTVSTVAKGFAHPYGCAIDPLDSALCPSTKAIVSNASRSRAAIPRSRQITR